jgi:hypothetical protein
MIYLLAQQVYTCNEINCNRIVFVSNCNLDLCNRLDTISNSNSNLCNDIDLLSNSNSNLCNDIDLLSNSNSNLCNDIDLLSNSNLYLCNYVYINPSTNGFGLGDCNFETSTNGTGINSTAVGSEAGRYGAYNQVTCVGNFAGRCNCGFSAVALGAFAGRDNLGDYSLAIGYNAGKLGSCNNTIILSAESADLNPASTGFFVSPITQCNVLCNYYLQYNTTTKEISYASNCNLPSGSGGNYDDITESNSQSNVSLCNEIDLQSNSNVTLCNTFNSFRPVSVSNAESNSNLYDVLTFNTTDQNYCYGNFNINQKDTNCLYNVALGQSALRECSNSNIIAIGNNAGDSALKDGSILIGMSAGQSNAGQNTVCIGNFAGAQNAPDNSIILNATGISFSPNSNVGGFYVNSPRQNASMLFNFQTKEITYSKHRFSKFIMDTQLSVTTSVSNPTILSRELGSMSFSGSTVTIPETGIYRIFYQLQYGQTNSTTARASIKSGLAINTNVQAEWATTYLRANSGIINASLCLEDITLLQANDSIKIYHLRMDTNTATLIGMSYGICIVERLN